MENSKKSYNNRGKPIYRPILNHRRYIPRGLPQGVSFSGGHKMTIGEKIASLRKQQNLTQEQLAKGLDISVPAVSKWEHGTTMPDISLLAPIARMLHTDINDLFSFQKDITEKEVDAFMGKVKRTCETQGFQAGMEQAFGYLKEYPSHPYLKLKTANAVLLYAYTAKDEEEHFQEWMEKSTALFEEVYKDKNLADGSSIRQAAAIALSSRYIQNGRLKDAEQLLETIPLEKYNAEQMLSRVYLEQGKLKQARNRIKGVQMWDLVNLLVDIRILFDASIKEKNMEEALQHAMEHYQVRKAMPLLLWCHPSELFLETYLFMGDLGHAMEHFCNMIDEIIETEFKPGQNGGFFMDKKMLYRLVAENPLYQPLLEKPEGKEKMEEFWNICNRVD